MKLPVLPEMRCDKGCGDCCGIVPVSSREMDAISAFVAKQGIKPKRQGVKCPMYQDGECKVYPVRPLLCRIFGHTPRLKCSRGYNVNVPDADCRKMVKANGPAVAFIHHLCFSPAEVELILRKAAKRQRLSTPQDSVSVP